MSEFTLIYERDGNHLIKSFVFKLNCSAVNKLLVLESSAVFFYSQDGKNEENALGNQ